MSLCKSSTTTYKETKDKREKRSKIQNRLKKKLAKKTRSYASVMKYQ